MSHHEPVPECLHQDSEERTAQPHMRSNIARVQEPMVQEDNPKFDRHMWWDGKFHGMWRKNIKSSEINQTWGYALSNFGSLDANPHFAKVSESKGSEGFRAVCQRPSELCLFHKCQSLVWGTHMTTSAECVDAKWSTARPPYSSVVAPTTTIKNGNQTKHTQIRLAVDYVQNNLLSDIPFDTSSFLKS